jgi:hypothetical protein
LSGTLAGMFGGVSIGFYLSLVGYATLVAAYYRLLCNPPTE